MHHNFPELIISGATAGRDSVYSQVTNVMKPAGLTGGLRYVKCDIIKVWKGSFAQYPPPVYQTATTT